MTGYKPKKQPFPIQDSKLDTESQVIMKTNLPVKLLSILLLVCISTAFKQDVPPRLRLFLLIGQSNMAGRGAVEADDQTEDPRIWMLTKDLTWVPARDPLHFDKPAVVGVGPGRAFARQVAATNPQMNIGLIPCAVGGSGIDVWQPGAYYEPTKSHPYDDALARAKKALEQGQLAGILWHQGESDSQPDKVAVYEQKLTAFINRLRVDLNAQSVPFIVGTLGDFYVAKHPVAGQVNAILRRLPATLRHVYCASATGLTDKGDSTHFDSASARALGSRYAAAYVQATKK